jgi:hypothetical protein
MSHLRTSRIALVAVVALLSACGSSGASASASPDDADDGFTARNDAQVTLAGPVDESPTLVLTEAAEDADFAGLTKYTFADEAAGFSMSVSLDPATPLSGAQPTSDQLVVAFTVTDGGEVFSSSAEECTVTFVNFNDDVIDGELECEVPSADGEVTAEGTGIFAFAPDGP